MEPFTDEPGIFAWEYFNEASGSQWIYESKDDLTPEFDRVAEFFINCTQIVTDEDITQVPAPTGAMVDKHLICSGMWVHNYPGWKSKYMIPEMYPFEKTLHSNNLLNNEIFCRYEDIIDWHTYGTDDDEYDPQSQFMPSCLIKEIQNFYTIGGYNDATCPPMIFGEISPASVSDFDPSEDYDLYSFAGYIRHLDNIPNDPTRNWWWEEIIDEQRYMYYSIIWDDSFILPIQIQSFDIFPCYIRQNQQYNLWKKWCQGISSLKYYNTTRKIGFMPWILVNFNGSLPQDGPGGVYDPAIRDSGGNITGYESVVFRNWRGIYLDEPNVYPFYKHLFQWDWGVR